MIDQAITNLLCGSDSSEFKTGRRKVVLFVFEWLCLLQLIVVFFCEHTEFIPLFYCSLVWSTTAKACPSY